MIITKLIGGPGNQMF